MSNSLERDALGKREQLENEGLGERRMGGRLLWLIGVVVSN